MDGRTGSTDGRTGGISRTDVAFAPAGAPTPGTYRRRRVLVLAGLEDPVAGHVVAAPGDTLWDIAVATAPDGVDARRQLASLRELNGLEGAHLDAWAVVLIPAR